MDLKLLNPKELNAESIESINQLTIEQLDELHSTFPPTKPFLKTEMTSGKMKSAGYATYGSFAALKKINHNIAVVGIVNETVNIAVSENKASAPLAPKRVQSVEVSKESGKVEDPNLEKKENIVDPLKDNDAELQELVALWEEKNSKKVPNNKAKNIEWIKKSLYE